MAYNRHIFNNAIYEYDIYRAGIHVAREKNFIDNNTFVRLLAMSKIDSSIELQNILKTFSVKKDLIGAINEYTNHFIEINKIPREQIISINTDAITFYGCARPIETQVGIVKFKEDIHASSYVEIDNVKFFYDINTKNKLCKGIVSKDNPTYEYLYEHPLVKFVFECIDKFERFNRGVMGYKEIVDECGRIQIKYVNLDLPSEWYRELNNAMSFKMRIPGKTPGDTIMVNYDNILHAQVAGLDISYNYTKFITPIFEILSELSRNNGNQRN